MYQFRDVGQCEILIPLIIDLFPKMSHLWENLSDTSILEQLYILYLRPEIRT